MTESILTTIKNMLGIPEADEAFDLDILVHINSAFMVLHQLGVGSATVFSITDKTILWSAFLTDPAMYSAAKTFIYLKVKLIFDPPATSFTQGAIKDVADEYAWRLMTQVPIPPEEV